MEAEAEVVEGGVASSASASVPSEAPAPMAAESRLERRTNLANSLCEASILFYLIRSWRNWSRSTTAGSSSSSREGEGCRASPPWGGTARGAAASSGGPARRSSSRSTTCRTRRSAPYLRQERGKTAESKQRKRQKSRSVFPTPPNN